MGQFGNKFRKAREAKSLSYDDVSNVTKIGSRMLQAIEEEHFDELPGGVFNKGFIRAYAKHLGLDSEEAVTGYLACLRQAQIDAADQTHAPRQPVAPPKPPAQKPTPQKTPQPYVKPEVKKQAQVEVQDEELPELQLPKAEHVRKPPREFLVQERKLPWTTIAAALIAIVLVAFLWIRRSHKHPDTASAKPIATTSQPATVAAAQATLAPTPATVITPAKASPVNTPTNSAPQASTQPTPPQPKPIQPPTQPPADHSSKDVTTIPATPAKAIDTTKPTPAPKAVTKMTLVIRASETTWISVTADGQLVSQETLIGPANVTIHATQQITARVGNAAGVSFVWNGQEYPAQGAESEVRTVTFDQTGMHASPHQLNSR